MNLKHLFHDAEGVKHVSSLPINPPARLLLGPGPINADPRVLRAMAAHLVGQYDPAMTGYMTETQQLDRTVFGYNARQDTVLTTLAALEAVLRRAGASVTAGSGVGAAYDSYADADTPVTSVTVIPARQDAR
ncbi:MULTISPECIES: hypothetical protein [Cryobacterium]|uniref:hypothetical protein n=1 Tax=Cryobacterium TaxID=69578 RepID=UPI0008AEFC1F|nr:MULTISPECIES: hypothetical protein [Cryobacterium]SEN49359.1 hypothetical protein SAMN05216281_108138 [Cryobacterium luteum]